MDKYKQYSILRQQLQDSGDVPSFMATAGFQLIKEKKYIEGDETVKERFTSIADTLSRHLPVSYQEHYKQRFFDIMWEGFLGPSTPVYCNTGKPNKGMPISCSGSYSPDSVSGFYQTAHEIAMLSKEGFGTSVYLGDIRPRGSKISNGTVADGVVPVMELIYNTARHISQGSCYHPDVEILTEQGFMSFDMAKSLNLKVLQVGEDGSSNFVYPIEWVEQDFTGQLVHFHDSKNINIKVTPNHRMFYKYRRRLDNTIVNGKHVNHTRIIDKNFTIKRADECPTHRDVIFNNSIIRVDGNQELTWDERLLIAFQADGNIVRSKSINTPELPIAMVFHFKKQRKIDRLKLILDNAGYQYTESRISDGSTNIYVKRGEDRKTLSWVDISNISCSKAIEILKEVSHWDGSGYREDKKGRFSFSYSTTVKENSDTLQALATMCGVKSSVVLNYREGKSPIYRMYFSEGMDFGVERIKKDYVEYSGKVYCAIVPLGGLVVRSNGHTLVCGNTRRGSVACYLPVNHGDFDEVVHWLENNSDGSHIGWCFTDEDIELLNNQDPEMVRRYQEIMYLRMLGTGYIFLVDNANRQNPQVYKDNNLTLKNSQLCSEITLYNSDIYTYTCCLSSLNLAQWDKILEDPKIIFDSIVFLDCVNSEFILQAENIVGLEKARRFAEWSRPVGLGVMGLSTYMQSKSIVFDSFEGHLLNTTIFKTMREHADAANKWLAEQMGEPELMKGTGLRCSHLIAVAPTLSNALISGGVSNGIEPFFANAFTGDLAGGETRRANPILVELLKNRGKWTKTIIDSIVTNNGSVQHLDFLSDHEKAVFRTAFEVDQMAIIRMAEARQRYIDQAQSINLFFSTEADEEFISYVHKQAMTSPWIKSLYYIRSNAGVNGRTTLSEQKSNCASCEG